MSISTILLVILVVLLLLLFIFYALFGEGSGSCLFAVGTYLTALLVCLLLLALVAAGIYLVITLIF